MLSNRAPQKKSSRSSHPRVEPLESRTLLSGSATLHPESSHIRADAFSSGIQGYTPSQIRKAYGFDQFTLSDGSPADGRGQTIAIVDPFNDPNIVSDLNVFDAQFGIAAPPTFKVVNASGGTHLPAVNKSWAGEISTDVESAHAIAPGADLLLVECLNDQTNNLMAGVDYARKVPGVSAVSISWGGGEFAGQQKYDDTFNTPTGHAGVTFVVAAGDNGAKAGAQWPATSPGVISVGGSVLTIADPAGTYGGETSWGPSSGGYSHRETEPAWQEVVQRTAFRSMPDVAYDADTNVGLALYDSIPFQGAVNWQTTSGTSVGAPQWAALIAIADQARRWRANRRSMGLCRLYPRYTISTARREPAPTPATPHILTTLSPRILARRAGCRPLAMTPPPG